MSGWSDGPRQQRAPKRSLAVDLMSVGPASTPAREVLSAIVQIGAVALLVFVIFPDDLRELWRWALLGATVLYFVLRAAAGLPTWRRR
ncbi:hypothetical protein [Micromonospora musae]|uniref:hypothetical protein n=1 Tax=Micromonospora musae TaxID=1894970 RepID=UPI00131580A9|nr:hypothetical protein [Micromonospora musae]